MRECAVCCYILAFLIFFSALLYQIAVNNTRYEIIKDICQVSSSSKKTFDECSAKKIEEIIFEITKEKIRN